MNWHYLLFMGPGSKYTCYTSPCCCSYEGLIRLQGCEILSFHWMRETVQIEVIIVRPNFHMNIAEQFTIRECMRPSFEGSVNMDL